MPSCSRPPQAGKHFTLAIPNRSAPQLAQALETIDSYPSADTIHPIMDNLNIHSPKTLTDYFGNSGGPNSGAASRFITPPKEPLYTV